MTSGPMIIINYVLLKKLFSSNYTGRVGNYFDGLSEVLRSQSSYN